MRSKSKQEIHAHVLYTLHAQPEGDFRQFFFFFKHFSGCEIFHLLAESISAQKVLTSEHSGYQMLDWFSHLT